MSTVFVEYRGRSYNREDVKRLDDLVTEAERAEKLVKSWNLKRVRNINSSGEGVVIVGDVQEKYRTHYGVSGSLTVVASHGSGYTYASIRELLLDWQPF